MVTFAATVVAAKVNSPWGRGSYEASRATIEPPQNLTSAVAAALAARSGDETMNSCSKPIGHPYEARRTNLVDNFS